jgi:hypothetical protein
MNTIFYYLIAVLIVVIIILLPVIYKLIRWFIKEWNEF